MRMRKLLLALALVGMASGGVEAAPYVGAFNTGAGYDGVLQPLTGFDVFSNGSAAFFCASAGGCGAGIANGAQINPLQATGLTTGSVITTLYQGVVNVVNTGLTTPGMVFPGQPGTAVGPGRYEFTVAAMFNELVLPGGGAFNAVLQPLNAGSRVSIFYDNNSLGGNTGLPGTFISNTAAVLAGVGYTDGVVIADGNINQAITPPTLVTVLNGQLTGVSAQNGDITAALLGALPNVIGFIPRPGDFEATTTLQLGGGIAPGFATVGFFDNANGWTRVAVNSAFVVRADANVDLSAAVPEPASLALLGIGLAGIGAMRRQRKS